MLKIYYISYIIFGLFNYIFSTEKKSDTRGYILIITLKSKFFDMKKYLKKFSYEEKNQIRKISIKEKNTILFILLKLFYIPLMADFWVKNCSDVYYYLREYDFYIMLNTYTIKNFNEFWYPLLISIIFSVDTFIFMFCYMFESKILKNKIISVDSTSFGWIVTLLCYHPFNAIGGNYLSWPATSYPVFQNIYLTFTIRILIVLLFCFYLFATISLGTRASNLTNRGIVTNGAYKFVRHPSYISKNLAWWISIIPVINITNILSMVCWSFIYFLRAITEERHLIKDSDYKKYCKKVKYRFIPHFF